MKTLIIERNPIAQGDKLILDTIAFSTTPTKGNLYWLTHKNHYYKAIGIIEDVDETAILVSVESVPYPPDHPAILVGRAHQAAIASQQTLLAQLFNRLFADWKNNVLSTQQLVPYASLAQSLLDDRDIQ